MKKNKKQKILVAGTFDHFHLGHQYFLWTSYYLTQNMVVIIARDQNVKKFKNMIPKNTETRRLKRVQQENIPQTKVRLGRKDGNFLKTITEENPDLIRLGYDQQIDENLIKQNFPQLKILRAAPYFSEYFKSSKF